MRPSEEAFVSQPVDNTSRRKALITIRHIPASTNYEKEGEDQRFLCAVEPDAKNNFTLPEVVRCRSSEIVYHEQVSSKQTRVTGLNFLLIGHNLNRDFSAYSCCVKSVEFQGHLSYTKPLFHIFSQLTSLEKVRFVIGGPAQLPFFFEPKNQDLKAVSPNINAKFLSIKVDIKNYKTSSDANKTLYEDILISVLERSGHCFPNLTNFYVELPCTGKLSKLTEELIETKWDYLLAGKLMTSYCPFAEALFVVPFRKEDPDCVESNDLDLVSEELLDILIGRPYTASSSYAYGVPNPFYGPESRNGGSGGSAVYYGRNYARYFPIERPRAPAPAVAPVAPREGRDEYLDYRRTLEILRQQNILGVSNQEHQDMRQRHNVVFRQNPFGPSAIDFQNNLGANEPRRRPFQNHRPFPHYDENDRGDNV